MIRTAMRVPGLLLLVLIPLGCGTPYYDYSKEPDPRKHEYVIGISDGLKIGVWKNPDLSTQVIVRPDGTITMPLLGDIQAAGRTPGQLNEEVGKRLRTYLKDDAAVVTITVTDVQSYRFTVGGNVEKGGVFSPKFYVTVSEAIALAGGLNKFASRQLYILRAQPGGTRRIPFNFDRIASGEHPEENLALLAGDTLFVP
jgi:polysaccharide export outer membrane protein